MVGLGEEARLRPEESMPTPVPISTLEEEGASGWNESLPVGNTLLVFCLLLHHLFYEVLSSQSVAFTVWRWRGRRSEGHLAIFIYALCESDTENVQDAGYWVLQADSPFVRDARRLFLSSTQRPRPTRNSIRLADLPRPNGLQEKVSAEIDRWLGYAVTSWQSTVASLNPA